MVPYQASGICGAILGKARVFLQVNDKVIFFSETKTKWNISSSDLVKGYRKDLKKNGQKRHPIGPYQCGGAGFRVSG
jgi:hypothetical protein